MTVSDILDGAFKLLKANIGAILVVEAVFVAPFQVIAAFAQRNVFGGQSFLSVMSDPSTANVSRNNSPGTTYAQLIVAGINLLLLPFVAGAVSRIVGASYMGQEISAGPAIRATARRLWSLISASFLVHLMEFSGFIVGAVFIVVAVVAGGGARVIAVILAVLSFAGGIPVFVGVLGLSVPVAPVIVAEELGPIQGIRRSWRLVRRRFWPVLFIALLAGLMAQILGSVVGIVPELAAFAIGLRWGWILLGAGSVLVSAFVLPIVAIVATLLYYDARIRTEGFDLQVLAGNLARQQQPAAFRS